ncbi:uncharacterized protein [Littorina saxatilis]|uniref:uncharacterized protein n=1 Tax=Littorina saxatilis TaxID=31220 RepID=UPI0038B66A79
MMQALVKNVKLLGGHGHLEGKDALMTLHSETIPPQISNERIIANLKKQNVSRHDTHDACEMYHSLFKVFVTGSFEAGNIGCTDSQKSPWTENFVPQSKLKILENEYFDQMNTEEMFINKGNKIEFSELDRGLSNGSIILPDLPFFDHVDEVLSSLFKHLESMSCVYQGDMLPHGFFYCSQLRAELKQLPFRYLRARSQEREKCIRLISQVCREKPVEDAQIMSFHQRSLLLRRVGCYAEYIFEMLNTFMYDLTLYSIPQEKDKPLILLKKARDTSVSEMETYIHINMLVSRKQAEDVPYEDKDAADVVGNQQRKRSKSIPSQISDSDSDSLSDNCSCLENDIQNECHIPEKGNDRISNVDSVTNPDRNQFRLDIKRAVERFMLDTPTAHGARTASGDPDLLLKELTPTLPSFPDPSLDEHDAHQQPVVPFPEFQDPRVGKEPHLLHWTVTSFRPRDSVRPRPRYSPQVRTEPFTLDNLRQRMQQRSFRIASMVHLGSSLPLGVVRLADADLYYDEDKDEMCCCNCSWRMPRTQFQDTKDPVEGHSCRGRTRGDCGEGSRGISGPAARVAQEDSLPLAERRDNALPPCVEVDGYVERNASDSPLLADDTVTDCISSSESIAQFPRERCTAECSGSFHQLGSETSSATMDALLSTGETASLVQQSSSNNVSCTNDQSPAEGTGFETDHTSSGKDMGSGQSPCLHTAEFITESLTDAADKSFSENEATRHDSETESTYHESHSPTESCGDKMHEDETDLKS